MNTKERGEWMRAVTACVPDADVRAMTAAVAALDAAGSGHWEVSVSGRGLHSIGLRFFGVTPYASWAAACAKIFSLGKFPGPVGPSPEHPWLSVTWDLSAGAWTTVRLCGVMRGGALKSGQTFAWDFAAGKIPPLRRLLAPAVFKPGIFREPVLDQVLEDFSRLCPLSTLSVEEPGWSLRLKRPLRWPLFASSDLSGAFTPHSSQLALFLLDRHVTELSFDGEALWAHCAG